MALPRETRVSSKISSLEKGLGKTRCIYVSMRFRIVAQTFFADPVAADRRRTRDYHRQRRGHIVSGSVLHATRVRESTPTASFVASSL